MPIVTKITTQKKNTGRYNVYLDDGQGEKFGFSVDEYVLVEFQLKRGKEIDDLDIAEIQYADDVKKAYNMALSYLSFRMRAQKEVRGHLKLKGLSDAVIQEVLHKLEEQRYIDDEEFAKAFARTQINTTIKGPELIRRELREKGIADEHIDSSLLEFSIEGQLQTAQKIAGKLREKEKRLSTQALKRKIEQTLQQKGYSVSVIQQTFREIEIEKDQDEEWEALKIQGLKAHRRYEKYDDWEYERKMKQSLYRKGFAIEKIDQLLEEIKTEKQ